MSYLRVDFLMKSLTGEDTCGWKVQCLNLFSFMTQKIFKTTLRYSEFGCSG